MADAGLSVSTPIDVRLVDAGFSPGHPLSLFARAHPDAGGIASFVGQVRGEAKDGSAVRALELVHYEPLTRPGMDAIVRAATERFALSGLLAWHRIGVVDPGAAVVLVAAAAPHRRAALQAVDYTMDHLKSAAWFWKRERRGDGPGGSWHWIEPTPQDHADRERWD